MAYTESEISAIVAAQRKFFRTGTTLPVKWRIQQLKKLKAAVIAHETELEDGSSQRWKQETATACECQERAAYHARIDADKCIDVVQLHHQVGGDGKAAEL